MIKRRIKYKCHTQRLARIEYYSKVSEISQNVDLCTCILFVLLLNDFYDKTVVLI